MHFSYCILCEDIRPETGNKVTILGFFGVCPSVIVMIRELGLQIKIFFFVGIESDEDRTIKVLTKLLNPDESILLRSPETDIALPANRPTAVGFVFLVPFGREGRHIFSLESEGQEIWRTTFEVRRGVAPPAPGL